MYQVTVHGSVEAQFTTLALARAYIAAVRSSVNPRFIKLTDFAGNRYDLIRTRKVS